MTKQEILSIRIRRAVSKDIGLAGVMLYVPAVVRQHAEHIAWTDGKKMYFSEGFFELEDDAQVAVCIHEALHVIFRHIQRGQDLYKREGSTFHPRLWNIACDAVINHAIGNIPWTRLPADCVQIERVLGKELLQKRPAETWTAEQIYSEIQKCPEKFDSLEFYPDLIDGDSSLRDGADFHEREMENRLWRERIVRAQAGSLPGGLLRKLSADIPKPAICWEQVLRAFLKSHCMPVTEQSWNRPSRRSLSLGPRTGFIEAGCERSKGIHRIGVVVDTSGSIDAETLATFIGEINGILRLTSAEAVVVDCDATVQKVEVFRQPIREYQAKGGGGTDFRPGFEELRRQRVTLAVYLTDLCGTFPERPPSFPVFWAATQDREIPFGRKVLIPER